MPDDKQVYDPPLVIPEVVVIFFETFLFKRARLNNASESAPHSDAQLSNSTILQVRKALSDLQRGQSLDPRYHDRMRGLDKLCANYELNQLIKSRKQTTAQGSSRSHKDASKGPSIHNIYSDKQHYQMCTIGLLDDSPKPPRHCLLRACLMRNMHATMHAFAFRGDTLRNTRLLDTFCEICENEGTQVCTIINFAQDNVKSKRKGKVEVFGSMRHATTPELCPHFHYALTSFILFTFGYIEVPNWVPRTEGTEEFGDVLVHDIYKYRFLPQYDGRSGKVDPRKAMSSSTMNSDHRWIFDNIQSPLSEFTKECHLKRVAATKRVISNGVSLERVTRAAGWKSAGSSDSYLTGLSLEFIRERAGFPMQKGHFYLARAIIDPPDELVAKVFEVITASYQAYSETEHFILDGGVKEWIDLLSYLAKVLVQDLAVLKDKMSRHPVFTKAPFADDSYGFLTYRSHLFEAMRLDASTRLRMTAEAARERGDRMCASFCEEVLKSITSLLEQNGLYLENNASYNQGVRLIGTPQRQLRSIYEATVRPRSGTAILGITPSLPGIQSSEHLNPPTSPLPQLARAATLSNSTDDGLLFNQQALVLSDPSTWPIDPPTLPPFAVTHQLRDKPATIKDLYDEYIRGYNGGPPLKALDEFYGPGKRSGRGNKFSWRCARARDTVAHINRSFNANYAFRAVFFKYIDHEIAHGKNEAQAVADLQARVDATLSDGKVSDWTAIRSIRNTMAQELYPEIFEKSSKRALKTARQRAEKRSRTAGAHTIPQSSAVN